MINEERVKLETKLAIYEQGDGKEELKINSYYKGDYIGLNQVLNIICMTIGYALIVGIGFVMYYDLILEGLSLERIKGLAILIGVVYGVLLILYLVLDRIYYAHKHKKAKDNVRLYYGRLHKLTRMYNEERFQRKGKKRGGRRS